MGGRPTQPALPIAAPRGTDDVPPLLIVDGHNLLWGATFGFPAPIYSRDKTRVLTGVFAFFALLRVAIRDEVPGDPEVIVVFDGEHGSTARQERHEQYKASRPGTAEAMLPLTFLADVKRGLDQHGVAWVELEHAEADDVIASITRLTPEPRQVIIMSRDRDFYQLIDDRVLVLNTKLRPGQRLITPAEVYTRHHVLPSQWADYRALCGDPADDIPGVCGIGAKTAAALLDGGLTLDTLADSGRLTTGRGRIVAQQLDLARKWRELIRLDTSLHPPVRLTGVPSSPLPRPADILEELGLW